MSSYSNGVGDALRVLFVLSIVGLVSLIGGCAWLVYWLWCHVSVVFN